MTQQVIKVRASRHLPWPLALLVIITKATTQLITTGVLLPAAMLLRCTTVGRGRRAAAPLWVAVLAAIHVRDIAWAWAAASTVLVVLAHRTDTHPNPRILSARERWLWQRTCATIGLWQVTRGVTHWRTEALALVVIALAAGVPWWRGGRGRVFAAAEDPRVTAWREAVDSARAAFDLRGSELTLDPAQPSPDVAAGTVTLQSGVKASTVWGLDEHVASLLDMQRGTVTIGTAPNLSARQVRVAFSRPGQTNAIVWWEGPTLERDGTYNLARTPDGQLVADHLWHETGGSFNTYISAPRRGKGVAQRLAAIEAGLSEHVWQACIDGKYGAGLPEIRDACDVYVGPGPTPEDAVAQWRMAIDMVYAIFQTRGSRYGTNHWSRWRPRPGEPLIRLVIDESLVVMNQISARHIEHLVDISGGGSSLGFAIALDTQRGDQPSFGSTTLRANLRGTGMVWIGPAGDVLSSAMAVQEYDVDPAALPAAKGWAWHASQLYDLPPTMARTLYLPSRIEVEDDGVPAPFGAAEDWAAKAVHPQLHPDDQAAIDAVRERYAAAEECAPQDAPSPGAAAGTPARGESEGRIAVARVLLSATEPLERGEIAQLTGKHLSRALSGRYVSEVLSSLSAAGKVQRVPDGWVWADEAAPAAPPTDAQDAGARPTEDTPEPAAPEPARGGAHDCPDCSAEPGRPHEENCDVAVCLATGDQRLSCGALGTEHDGDCGEDIWTGQWPGLRECTEWGWWIQDRCSEGMGWVPCAPGAPGAVPDLFRLRRDAQWSPESQRWVR